MSVYYNESLTHAVARRQPILICIEGINPNSEVLYNIYIPTRKITVLHRCTGGAFERVEPPLSALLPHCQGPRVFVEQVY